MSNLFIPFSFTNETILLTQDKMNFVNLVENSVIHLMSSVVWKRDICIGFW